MIIQDISTACEVLSRGELLGLPTETVYGLAGRIDRPETVRKIFALKERPFFDPLIVHCSSQQQAQSLCLEWSDAAEALAKEFWPGPLTLVMPKLPLVDDLITSGMTTVGLRVPAHPLTLQLLNQLQVPVSAPSANKFGRTSPTCAEHVQSEFGPTLTVLDGGPCSVGIESSIVRVTKDCEILILRKGLIPAEQIAVVLTRTVLKWRWGEADREMAPGRLKHHYMPDKPLILLKGRDFDDEQIINFLRSRWSQLPDKVEGVEIKKPKNKDLRVYRLDLPQDPSVAARELYSQLRIAAQSDKDLIVYSLKTSASSLWDGIYDRLNRAATFVID